MSVEYNDSPVHLEQEKQLRKFTFETYDNNRLNLSLIKTIDIMNGTPFEAYVMKYIYPEIINGYLSIPEEFLSNKLLDFRKDLINNEIEALKFFIKLRKEPLSSEHLAYYYIIKQSLDELNPCIKKEAEDLLSTKTKQVDARIEELTQELKKMGDLTDSLEIIMNEPKSKQKITYIYESLTVNSSFKAVTDLPSIK